MDKHLYGFPLALWVYIYKVFQMHQCNTCWPHANPWHYIEPFFGGSHTFIFPNSLPGLAAEKRKAEMKANPKSKAKAKARTAAKAKAAAAAAAELEDEELPEEWPETEDDEEMEPHDSDEDDS